MVSFLLRCAVLLTLVGLPSTAGAQQARGPWPLAAVSVDGAARYAAADVVRLSGLKTGQTISLDDLQQLANDMMVTGLFRRLGFSYSVTPEGGLRLTLRIEEPAWTVPLVFDNIIWLSDSELAEALAARVPAFDGTVVEGGVANEFISTATERILEERGITADVAIEPRLDVRTNASSYALVVREGPVSLEVCSIGFSGADNLPSGLLEDAVDSLVGHIYSRSALASVTGGILRQAYRERGYWRASFDVPTTTTATGCDGLMVSVPVNEGARYAFAGARWVGASAVDEEALNRALDLRVGATADGRRLNAGLATLERAYHERGYVAAATGVTAEFDEVADRVTFVIQVREGPQFRMGALEVVGLTDRQTADLTRRWRLAPGDVFDGPYYQDFLRDQAERIGGGLRGNAQLNHDAATVDVTFSVDQ